MNRMKKVNKLGLILAAMCLMLFFPVIPSQAADGVFQFSQTDYVAGVGQEVTVTFRVAENGGAALGDVDATINYDPAILEYVSGSTNVPVATVVGAGGTVTLTARGTGGEAEYSVNLVFRALTEGTVTLSSQVGQAWLFNDDTLNLQPGMANVTVQTESVPASTDPGVQTGSENIEINGVMYAIYENFTEALVPEGFTQSTIQYNGAMHNAIVQDLSGTSFVYLVTGSEDPVMAMYDESAAGFVLAAQVNMADGAYLLILGQPDGTSLPSRFASTTLNLNGLIFPAWQDMESTDYYLVYGLSYLGTRGYYQYDSVEQTYQRYTLPVETEEPKEETDAFDNPLIEKARGIVNKYFLIVAVAAAMLLLAFLIILIVLGVKVGHRNAEIDDLYDELDEINGKKKKAKRQAQKKNVKKQKPQYEEDEYDDDEYEDDEYDDDEYEDDEYEEDEYDDDEYEDDEYDEDEYDEYEDDEFDDEDDVEEYVPKKRRHSAENEDVDFIDL